MNAGNFETQIPNRLWLGSALTGVLAIGMTVARPVPGVVVAGCLLCGLLAGTLPRQGRGAVVMRALLVVLPAMILVPRFALNSNWTEQGISVIHGTLFALTASAVATIVRRKALSHRRL